MFKKDPSEHSPSTQIPAAQPPQGRKVAASGGGASAVIGPSITIKGDVSGDEDLVILGKVQGTVSLTQHNVTIGPSGKVKADVRGKNLIVQGEVEGDLKAEEQIILRNTARVEGTISAPRVALEDGAVFRGGIEMDSTSAKGREPQAVRPVPDKTHARDKEAESSKVPQSPASGKDLPA